MASGSPSLGRRIAKVLLRLTAALAGLLGALMAVAGIRWLIIEMTTGARDTQPLFGIDVSLGQALTGGATILIAIAMCLWWVANGIRRQSGTPLP